MRRLALALPVLAVVAPLALRAGGGPRLRHEYVPPSFFAAYPVGGDEAPVLEPGEPLPAALRQDGVRLPAPGDQAPDAPTFRPDDQPVPPPPGDIIRPSAASPDRQTGADARLTYNAVFNPEVAPLRRNVAFDLVGADYRMSIAPGPLALVPLSPRRAAPDREMFWGDVTIDTAPGRPSPIPSVAPDMGVVAVRTEPAGVAVTFLKDGADNYYVRSEHQGTLRVVFLADAHRAYFSAPVPDNVPLGAGAGDPATALPPGARAAAARVLPRLGLEPSMAFAAGLDRLVEYFRSFRAGPPPEAGGDIFEDLALGQVGVCRHRAFAFLVAARALGVPTRYVQNEAHAFVEVRAPDGRWRRVDLGGEAPSLDVKGADRVRLHTPPPDPFPKPQSYLESYSAAVAGAGGPPRPAAGDEVAAGGGPSSAGSGKGPRVPLPVDGADGGLPGAPEAPPGPTSGGPGAGGAAAPASALRAVTVVLEAGDGDHEAFRGEALPFDVAGRVTAADEDEPAAGVPVQLYLLPLAGGRPVGVGVELATDASGRFRGTVTLPPSVPLGRYRVVAATGAHGGWAPGRSGP